MIDAALTIHRGWFDCPPFPGPTPVRFWPRRDGITLFHGHVATNGQRHVDHEWFSVDLTESDDLTAFHRIPLACADDTSVWAGPVTETHAPTNVPMTLAAAAEWSAQHAVGWARVARDRFGLTAAGFLDGHTDVRARLALSGDWRDVGAGLRLVGLSLTRAPGLPVPGWSTPGVHVAFPGVAASV